jgi:polar amino acid transport system substrate-binding protein
LQSGVLKIGTTSDSKPYAYTENGTLKGFEVDMARTVAEHIGLKPVFVQQEFSTLLPAVAAGSLDVEAASSSVTPERLKIVDFSDIYFIASISVLTTAKSGITKDTATLKGKKLGLIQGTIEDQYAQKHFTGVQISRFPDNNAAVNAMKAGSIDAVFLDYPPAQAYVDQDSALEIPINIPVPDFPVAMGMHKDRPRLKAAINKAIAEIIASGEWLTIQKRYYPNMPVDPKFMPTKQQ